jgi:DNA-binding NarL/FixJ family response regulator
LSLARFERCVLLVGRHHGLARVIDELLGATCRSVTRASTPAELLQAARRVHADLAVIDLSMIGQGALEWLSQARIRLPGLKLLVITSHDEQSVRRSLLESGADSVVLKRALVTDLLPAIESFFPARPEVSAPLDRPPESTP